MTNPTPHGVTLREALTAAREFINDVHYGEWAGPGYRRNDVQDKITEGFAALSHPPAPEQASDEETAWCIEQNLSPIPPEWFIGGPINSVEFSSNPNKAMRFSRRKDAQAMLDWFRCNNKLLVCDPNVEHFYKVTEHKWLSASPAAP